MQSITPSLVIRRRFETMTVPAYLGFFTSYRSWARWRLIEENHKIRKAGSYTSASSTSCSKKSSSPCSHGVRSVNVKRNTRQHKGKIGNFKDWEQWA